MSEWMPEGYPTEEALERIRTWDPADGNGLLDWIRDHCFNWPERQIWDDTDDFFDLDDPVPVRCMSTGGWSGNEDVIHAMQQNRIWWSLYWVQSHVGGHHKFKLSG